MKIENRSRKRSHKLDGIGVGRIRTVPFSSDSAYEATLMIQRKLDCRSRKQKRKNKPITMPGLFFGFRLRLRQSSFHWIGVISGIGRNWNRSDSAYDSYFRFSLVRSAYDSDYDSDSDSVASENQPLRFTAKLAFNDRGYYMPARGYQFYLLVLRTSEISS